jgi:hypothetical protein
MKQRKSPEGIHMYEMPIAQIPELGRPIRRSQSKEPRNV